jgi:hypothetical protein
MDRVMPRANFFFYNNIYKKNKDPKTLSLIIMVDLKALDSVATIDPRVLDLDLTATLGPRALSSF